MVSILSESHIEELKTQGFTVVRGVLSPDQVKFGIALFQNWWASNGPLEIPAHGVFKFHRVGHSAFAWWTRTRPTVRRVFQDLWGTENLITSFDGFGYWSEKMNRRNTNWMHVDQAPNDPVYRCVQGSVAFTESRSFMVAPGSHRKFESYMADHNLAHGSAWQKVPEFYESATVVSVEPGDMILWDSRTAHQNRYQPVERLTQYVCMLPRSRAPERQLEKRRKYFTEKRTTSHWPTPIRVNGLQPQVYGNRDKLIRYDALVETDAELLESLSDEINKLV